MSRRLHVRLGVRLGCVSLLIGLAAGACAEDLQVPPAVGQPCERDADCQLDSLPCGQVLACLRGRCEEAADEPGLVEPCESRSRLADAAMLPDADTDAGR